jgi:hypothetical protein
MMDDDGKVPAYVVVLIEFSPQEDQKIPHPQIDPLLQGGGLS